MFAYKTLNFLVWNPFFYFIASFTFIDVICVLDVDEKVFGYEVFDVWV